VRRSFTPRTVVEWVVGEIGSLLRVGSGLRPTGRGGYLGDGSIYTLDSSRVNYWLTRELYRNTNDGYKLGAGFAKPVINATAGFMGVPNFRHSGEDDAMDAALDDWLEKHVGRMLRVNRNTLRDGDVWARLVYLPDRFSPNGSKSLRVELVPPEWVDRRIDVLSGLLTEVTIAHPQVWTDDAGRQHSFTLTETVTAKTITLEPDNTAPREIAEQLRQTVPNPLGFVPFVHFKNESEENELYGFSDLEPVEPFLKAYHDNMMNALGASKLHGRPKVKIRVADVKKWKANNLTATELAAGAVNLAGRDLIFLEGKDDDVEILAPNAGIEGIMSVAKYLFRCIVDVSETPEFAFGTAVASSKASVSEQMIPFAAKIRRKRGQDEEYWGEFGAMLTAGISTVENMSVETYNVDQDWDEINARTDKDVADTINTVVQGLTGAVDGNLMSIESASDFLREFVPTMLPYLDPENPLQTEKARIEETAQTKAGLSQTALGLEGANDPANPALPPGNQPGGANVVPFASRAASSSRQPAPPRRRRRG
jgi:hypothetical protein